MNNYTPLQPTALKWRPKEQLWHDVIYSLVPSGLLRL